MTRFRFRLETLLKLRQSERNALRERLADALVARRVLDERRRQWIDELGAMREQARGAGQPGSVNVDTLLASHRYHLMLEAQGRVLDEQEVQIEAEIDRRRAALAEGDKQVRVLEKLRERQHAAHQQGELRAEQKLLDEVAQRGGILKEQRS